MAIIRRRTRVALIIDESGSMHKHKTAVHQGYRDFIRMLRETPAETRVSCTTFANDPRDLFADLRVMAVPDSLEGLYDPDGDTALYEAVGRTVTTMERQPLGDDRALVVIMTDGHNTEQGEWTLSRVKALIQRLEATGNWTFLFLGDDLGLGKQMGIRPENVSKFTELTGGVREAFAKLIARVEPLLLTEGAESRVFNL